MTLYEIIGVILFLGVAIMFAYSLKYSSPCDDGEC